MFMWTNCHPGTLSMHQAVSEKIFKPLNPIHHELNFSLCKEMKVSKPMFELDLLHVLITADIISFNREKYTLDAWSSVSFLLCTFPLASNNQPPLSLVHLLYWCSVLLYLETPSYLVRTDVESRIMITHWSGTGPENEVDSNSVILAVYPLNPPHWVDDQWRGLSGCMMISLWSVMNQRQTPEMMVNSRILLHWFNINLLFCFIWQFSRYFILFYFWF